MSVGQVGEEEEGERVDLSQRLQEAEERLADALRQRDELEQEASLFVLFTFIYRSHDTVGEQFVTILSLTHTHTHAFFSYWPHKR